MAVTAEEMLADWSYPHPSLEGSHQDGATEPWVANLLRALLLARGGHPIVWETGGFQGTTSAWLALTLEEMGGGQLCVCEIDPERVRAIEARLTALAPVHPMRWRVEQGDVLQTIQRCANKHIDFAWIDDDHQKHHVEQEIVALWPKMKSGGIMAFHDIDAPCYLGEVVKKYGGIALTFPKLGPAGGLGILQVP